MIQYNQKGEYNVACYAAWYDVTYSCGHKGKIQLDGEISDRQYQFEQEHSKQCPECNEEGRESKNIE